MKLPLSKSLSENPSRRRLLKGGLATMLGAPLLAAKPLNGAETTAPVSSHTTTAGAATAKAAGVGAPVGQVANMSALFETIKREASAEELYRFLYAMPKGGDIHHHLGGGFLPYMWLKIASDPKRNGGQRFYTRYRATNLRPHPLLNAPGVSHVFQWRTLNEKNFDSLSADYQKDFKPLDGLDEAEQAAWMSSVVLDDPREGRNEFFEYHWTRLGDLLSSLDVMSELFVENMKLFAAEGVRYLEIQRVVFGQKDAKGEVQTPEVTEAFWEARLAQPDAVATGVTVRWQGVALRFAANAEETIRNWYSFIDKHRDRWVGLNMAGREDDNRGYPSRFKGVFDEMLRKYPGIGISIHAGEAEKPDSYIRDTLRLGATRIGHGINLLSDEDTLLRMRDSRFLVEINLISNELLGYVPNLELHPFPIYLRQGVPCCLNTDDRGMWDSNYTDEVFVAVKHFNLSWDELQKTAHASYHHSFAEAATKQSMLDAFDQDIQAFAAQFDAENWRSIIAKVPATTHGYGRNVLGLQLDG